MLQEPTWQVAMAESRRAQNIDKVLYHYVRNIYTDHRGLINSQREIKGGG